MKRPRIKKPRRAVCLTPEAAAAIYCPAKPKKPRERWEKRAAEAFREWDRRKAAALRDWERNRPAPWEFAPGRQGNQETKKTR